MGKRDRIKRGFKDLYRPSASASESASNASATVLDPREPRLASGTPLTGNRDAPVRDLWGLALENLSLQDKEAMSRIKSDSDSKLDILRHLHSAAVKKRTDCENQMWKFELNNGRQIILRDVAQKIIVWVDKFKEIGDIAVNFDPVHASLPWAGVRFLLEMTVAESRQMGALLTGVERMAPLIGRCQIYEVLYLKTQLSENEEWKSAATNLTSALVPLYATILGFLASAIRAYNQSLISRTLYAILNPAEVTGFLEKCQALESNVAIEVDNCDRIHTRQIQAHSEEQIQTLKQILVDLQTPILRLDSRVAGLCEKLDSSERLKMLEWISGIRYEENHYFASKGRTSGTCEWLLRHERYREWRASSASMILWLHGDPGAGKTKLVSAVVDDLLSTFEQLPNDEAFAYFYCDRNQSDRQDPTLILSSFVRQLSTTGNNDAIPRSTVQMYNQKRQTAFASGKLKLEESRVILADLFRIYPQITLVVDALDECDKNTRSDFIDVLNKLVDDSPKPLKILISSRQDRDIRRHFEEGQNLQISAVDNRDDIAMFVNHEIEKLWRVKISSELKELICTTLVDGSEGMFQWASLQIAALRELCREQDIRNRLGKLPKTLKTAYDQLYLKIQSQEESTPKIANRAFQWVMCSGWPLSPTELVIAVCQDPDTDNFDDVDIDIKIILDACQNLLVVDQELNVCRFSHLSVQEYFEIHHWSSCEADCLVGKVCLSLLINTPKQETLSMREKAKEIGAHDVFDYACLNWAIHVQRLEKKDIFESRLTALLKHFLGSMDGSSLAYQNWHKTVTTKKDPRSHGRLPWDMGYVLSPSSRASLAIVTFGLYKSILDWWTVGITDVNQKNSEGDSLLILAAREGWVSIAEHLLKKRADVNARGGRYGSALQAASYRDHESIVQLLLDKGADINATGGRYGSALQAASCEGHESIVQQLLDKGADINATGGEYGGALQAASYWGHESIVQQLLDKGADVSATGGVFGSALQTASGEGHESIVQQLLDKGADINAASEWYGSALEVASYGGHESIMQLLLDNGADINATGEWYGSALQAASYGGHESIVQQLLDKGADVNATGGVHGSGLDADSYWDLKPIVQQLLDKGADVNATGRLYGSALQAASYGGHESIVQLLLDNGADVHAIVEGCGSALQVASAKGHESVVQLLQAAMKPE